MPKIIVIVPAYNEEKRIGAALDDLIRNGYKNIVVIDDGSKDRSGQIALSKGAVVLTHKVNRGQGAALRTGIEYAISIGADIIVTFDSDGQQMASEMKGLIKPVADGEVDITIGSRFLPGQKSQVPMLRKMLLFGSRVVILIFYGLWMTDAHNGYRAMSREAAQKIEIRSNRMEHASEIIGEMKRNSLRYKEVPVTVRYTEETLQKGAGGIVQAFKVLIKMIMQKLMR